MKLKRRVPDPPLGGRVDERHRPPTRFERFRTGVEGVSFVGLQRDDIVRSDLVMSIVDAYEGAEEGDGA